MSQAINPQNGKPYDPIGTAGFNPMPGQDGTWATNGLFTPSAKNTQTPFVPNSPATFVSSNSPIQSQSNQQAVAGGVNALVNTPQNNQGNQNQNQNYSQSELDSLGQKVFGDQFNQFKDWQNTQNNLGSQILDLQYNSALAQQNQQYNQAFNDLKQ